MSGTVLVWLYKGTELDAAMAWECSLQGSSDRLLPPGGGSVGVLRTRTCGLAARVYLRPSQALVQPETGHQEVWVGIPVGQSASEHLRTVCGEQASKEALGMGLVFHETWPASILT